MSFLLMLIGLVGMCGILWYANEHVDSRTDWVYHLCGGLWGAACVIFAAKVYFS